MPDSLATDKIAPAAMRSEPGAALTGRTIPVAVLVAAVAGVTFFTVLGSAQLFDEDEPKNAACAREMFVRNDWITPTFNEDLRTVKPILLYWLTLSAYHVFGVTEFAARFWSALLGVGTCLLTCELGRILFSRAAGAWAGLIMASTLMFTAVARAATPDSVLIFLCTLAMYLFARLGQRPGIWQPDARATCDVLTARPRRLVPVYAALALAALAKGPVGILLPCAVIGLFLYVESIHRPGEEVHAAGIGLRRWFRPRELWRVFRSTRPALLLLCVLLIACPWYAVIAWRTDGAWLAGFLGHHNIRRFLEPFEGHSGTVLYYVPAILAGFFPWSVFLPRVAMQVIRRVRAGTPHRRSLVFLTCWAGVWVAFFTLARTKLPNYVLPCYPALALLTGWLLAQERWLTAGGPERGVVWALGSLTVAGLLLAAGAVVASRFVLPGEASLGLVGVVPAAGGVLSLWLLWRAREGLARCGLAVTAVLLAIVLFGWAAPRISRHQDGAFAAAVVKQHTPRARIATFRYSAPSLVYYAQTRIATCWRVKDVVGFLSQPSACLVTTSDRLHELARLLPEDVTVLARRKRFLRGHDIVVLGRESRRQTPLRTASRRDP
jgi:4-amino-4-deoxy-L-arabinose transferase-like glycosyltransferase